jgi:oligoendopeptidase F
MTVNSSVKKVPVRSEIPDSDKWDLTTIFKTDDAWEQDFEKLKTVYPKLGEYKGRLAESAKALKEYFDLDREIGLLAENLSVYAFLRKSEDGAATKPQDMMGRFETLCVKLSELTAFESPELMAISDEQYNKLIQDPLLSEWEIALERRRRYKPHILSEAEEKIMALASAITGGPSDTYDALADVNMKFGEIENSKGEKMELSHGTYAKLLRDPSQEIRRKAFVQYYQEFNDHGETIAANFSTSIKGDVFKSKARNYPSAREKSLFDDNVPVSVYDNLVKTIKDNQHVMDEYFAFRKEVLGLKELHHYDTYAPLVSSDTREYSWDEGCDLVLKGVEILGKEYVDTLRDGFGVNRWCDRYENKGKDSGAFSSGGYATQPYILMNYKGLLRDIFTLAHEAGHSMHSHYSHKNQPFQYGGYPIFLAEVASTTNETLLTDYLLKNTEDPHVKATILANQIDDIRSTINRQTMFAEFEKIIHERYEKGEGLTLEYFKEAYGELLKLYLGKEIIIDEQLKLECLRIPHFYRAFYVYKYATGLSAAIALAEGMLEGKAKGDSKPVEKYLGFLKSGCSKFPIDTLKDAGVDMSTPEPIEKAMKLMSKRIKELKELWPQLKK